jgi:putative MFS transporter
MSLSSSRLLARDDRAHPAFFWLGSAAVAIGVGLHLPMFLDAAEMDFVLAGMPIDWHMIVGMTLIVGGTVVSWYGLRPPRPDAPGAQPFDLAAGEPPAAARAQGKLTWVHWRLMLILALGLIIDGMKPASLGFTIPGMSHEYALSRQIVSLFPLFALTGLSLGSYLWGVIGDQIGRRAAILLSGVMFVGTAICGTMPEFEWNLAMCFFMGLAAGGMLPVTYALLAECLPARHRGWALVLLGGLGLIGGYFAAAGCAALLEPYFGWRVMWLLNAPTGALLILCNPLIPESPRFLMQRGHVREVREIARRFGVPLDPGGLNGAAAAASSADSTAALLRPPFRSTTVTLNLAGLAWGLINFGLLLWLPAELRARGYSVAGSDVLLFRSALVALPTMGVAAWLYGRWSSKWTLFILAALTTLSLIGLSLIDSGIAVFRDNLFALFSLLMVGVNGLIAVLLPFSAENYPVLVRGRGTGLVAGSSKLGGLAAQVLTVASLVPGLGAAALALAFPMAVAAGLVARFGQETRRHPLNEGDR